MHVYLLTLGRGLKGPSHMHGALFLGARTLYFLCTYVGRFDSSKLAYFGPIGLALEEYKKTGVVPSIDESALEALVSSTPNSLALTPEKIDLISKSFWSGSKIIHDGGEKLVVWNPGFAGKLRDTIREWAQSNGIKTKGL